MKRKASISHDKAIVEELRRDPEFVAEYLRAVLKAVGLKLTVWARR
jgi:DNA-binding phage protein